MLQFQLALIAPELHCKTRCPRQQLQPTQYKTATAICQFVGQAEK
jgi:hypothetical protein